MVQTKKPSLIVLIVALAIVLIASILAGVFNTGKGATSVSRIAFETERGTLSGLLYMPKGASASDPRPTVIVTHGYLNSAEMQDANAIELSRRGYVVLALDMYDHGHSKGNAENTGSFMTFWPRSMYDAVQYMYDQPYVLKDEKGNGVIGVTGHSMGGFSSEMAVFYDEQDFATNGFRKIYASLTEGADYSYSAWLGLNITTADAMMGGRFMGKVAAQFDEFFFNADDSKGNTVVRKNYVATSEGKAFLRQEEGQPSAWYDTSDGGRRIVYQPYETHPWNHISTKTTADAVNFYNTAFAAFNQKLNPADGADQVWYLKELFELVALIALMVAAVPLLMFILKLPFFKNAVTELKPMGHIKAPKGLLPVILIIAILLPGIFFNTLMDADTGSVGMIILTVLGGLFVLLGAYGAIKNNRFGGIATAFFGALCVVLTRIKCYSGAFWTADSANMVGFWTLICACIAGMITFAVYTFIKVGQGVKLADYGITFKPMVILSSLCTAIVGVVGVYAVIFLIDLIFKTDFRIWVFAFKTFEPSVIPAMLRYLPTFAMYYLVSTLAICGNTNTEGMKGFKGYLMAIALNTLGIILWLVVQYGTLFATGAAPFNQALSGILLFAMVPTLVIAACLSRALYKRTGNIWTPAFFNAILMTVMLIANTCVYRQ